MSQIDKVRSDIPRVRPRRFTLGLPHLIFAAVLLLRLGTLVRLTGSSFLLPLRGDMHFYNDWALRILRGEISSHSAFYGLPGYAYLLALLYKTFGYNPFIPGFLQAVLDAGTAVLIYRIAIRTFSLTRIEREPLEITFSESGTRAQSRFIGVLGALGWAFFVPAEAYSAILMPTTWFIFAFWFVVWRIVKHKDVQGRRATLLLGILIGLTATTVATILILLPLVIGALLLKWKIDNGVGKTLGLRIVVFLAGVFLGTSPCWIHNFFVARDPVFLSAHDGINFWIGNNPVANGYPKFPPGLRAGQAAMLEDSIAQAEAASGHSLKRAEVSAYWSAKAKNYIVTHFGDWLKLLALKLRNFWNAFQYDDLSIITSLREQGIVLPGVYLGLVAAIAIPGMLFSWKLAPQSRWVAAAILLSMLALLPVFVTERYRLVAAPGLLIFAAFGLSILWQSIRTNQFRTTAIYLTLLIGSTIFVSWPQRDPSLWALDAYNSGWQALESNNVARAEEKLATAYAYVPDNTETTFALGNLRLAQQQTEAAGLFYHAALRLDPKHKGALNNIGVIALEAHRYRDAENWFRQANDVDPRNAKTHFLLAKTLLEQGNQSAAQIEIGLAIQLKPDQQEFKHLREEIEAHAH